MNKLDPESQRVHLAWGALIKAWIEYKHAHNGLLTAPAASSKVAAPACAAFTKAGLIDDIFTDMAMGFATLVLMVNTPGVLEEWNTCQTDADRFALWERILVSERPPSNKQ